MCVPCSVVPGIKGRKGQEGKKSLSLLLLTKDIEDRNSMRKNDVRDAFLNRII